MSKNPEFVHLADGSTIPASGGYMLNFYTGEEVRWCLDGAEEEALWAPAGGEQELLALLLEARGIKASDMVAFMAPELSQLHDPFLLEGLREAAERVDLLLKNGGRLLIYGDYDVDGTAAVSILINFIRDMGYDAEFYIPDRADEGYGISDTAVQYILSSAHDMLLTVDCGITARKHIEAIQKGRMRSGRPLDIIITDHHQSSPDTLPRNALLINPHLPDSRYPFKSLCGSGIAWKLVHGISILRGHPEWAERYLDLAALATIADIVDLNGENRVLASLGIKKMNRDPQPGLAALHAVSSGKPGEVDATRIGFMMAPRINAAGRMGDAKESVRLLTSESLQGAMSVAEKLDAINRRRQEEQEKVFQAALAMVEQRLQSQQDPVTLVWGEGWHHGVIGIVASKLVDRFHKPAFVLAVSGGEAVGSGRSVAGFDLFAALSSQQELLTRFGGHEQAGGFSLSEMCLDAFREGLFSHAEKWLTPEMRQPALLLEAELGPELLTLSLARTLSQLEPTGQGNRAPLFLIRNAVVKEMRGLSDGRHLKLRLLVGGLPLVGIGFGLGGYLPHLESGMKVEVAGWLETNTWQGRTSLQLRLSGLRLSESDRRANRFMLEAFRRLESLDCEGDWLYNGISLSGMSKDMFTPGRKDLAAMFRHFRDWDGRTCPVEELFRVSGQLRGESDTPIGFFRMMAGLLIFDELGLFSFTLLEDGQYRLERVEETGRVDLDESGLLQFLQEVADRG